MEVCSKQHTEIVFNGLDCPLCQALIENEGLAEEVGTQQDLVEKLETEIKWMKEQ